MHFFTTFQSNTTSNPYQVVHQATQSKKRHRRKKPLPQQLSKQPTMGLASLRTQHQVNTLRRSEECLTTSSPNSSSSSASESDGIGLDQPLAASNQFLEQPVWTRQTSTYGRGKIFWPIKQIYLFLNLDILTSILSYTASQNVSSIFPIKIKSQVVPTSNSQNQKHLKMH